MLVQFYQDFRTICWLIAFGISGSTHIVPFEMKGQITIVPQQILLTFAKNWDFVENVYNWWYAFMYSIW